MHKAEMDLSTLNKGSKYIVCVDNFNENGITQGKMIEVSKPL